MKLRHFLYDLTDVLLLHLILNIPSYVVELLPITPHWAFIIYLLGVAWAIVQLILGVQYRNKLLRWWERLPASAAWSMCITAVVLFAASLVDEILTHGWQF
jgi:Kef-type K+ transport system membrane component KefB